MTRRCNHDGWIVGCPDCEREYRLGVRLMSGEPEPEPEPYERSTDLPMPETGDRGSELEEPAGGRPDAEEPELEEPER